MNARDLELPRSGQRSAGEEGYSRLGSTSLPGVLPADRSLALALLASRKGVRT